MKKTIMILLTLLALAFAFTSCELESSDDSASVRFSISNDRTRTISSDNASIKITQYKFTLKRGTSQTNVNETDFNTITKEYTFTRNKDDSGIYTIDDILPGGYQIYVEALSEDNTVIGKSETVTSFLKRGDNSFTLEVKALSGKQTAVLTYTWDTNSYLGTAFAFEVTNEKGEKVTLDSDNYALDTSTAGKAVVTLTLSAGSYIVKASLTDSVATNVSYASFVDVVRFTNSANNITSTQSFADFGNVTTSATIITTVSEPIYATLTISKEDIAEGFKASVEFSNLPSGVAEKDITIDWYVDEIKWSSKTANKTFSMSDMGGGTYRVTAVMKSSSITGSMGSVSALVTI